MTDYAKRLDEIEVELSKWPYRAHNEAAFSDAISIARALLKERDQLEVDLQEMITIDHSRLSPNYGN